VVVALAAIPLSSIAVALTNFAVTRTVPPRTLPRLDFAAGVPDDCRTLVVIPALVATPDDLAPLLAQLEQHYLSSAGPSLSFALLTDHVDTSAEPDATDLLARAETLVRDLNRPPRHRHPGRGAAVPRAAPRVALERRRGLLDGLGAQSAASSTS